MSRFCPIWHLRYTRPIAYISILFYDQFDRTSWRQILCMPWLNGLSFWHYMRWWPLWMRSIPSTLDTDCVVSILTVFQTIWREVWDNNSIHALDVQCRLVDSALGPPFWFSWGHVNGCLYITSLELLWLSGTIWYIG